MTGTSFQACDIHSTLTNAEALFILPVGNLYDCFIRTGIVVFTDKMLGLLTDASNGCN
jgi:hypothetical protein